MTGLLTVHDLDVSYLRDGQQVDALRNISFGLERGEKLAVIGESGSGKSTLALALGNLLPRSAHLEGSINWHSFAAAGPTAGRDIGFVFQDPGGSLDPLQRVGAQVSEVIDTHLRLEAPLATHRTAELFERVGLPARVAQAYPFELSGGQRQRVAIACAIAADPALLIADEATSALDSVTQSKIADLIANLVSDRNMALIFITHDIALASGLADSIAVLQNGRLVELGSAQQIITAPRDAYVERLIGAHVSLEAPPLVEALNG